MALPEDQSNSLPFVPTPGSIPDFLFQPSIRIDANIDQFIHLAIEKREVIEIDYWISDNQKYMVQTIEPLYIFFQR
jgi:hypothetical protein